MGVQLLNENKLDEMCTILLELQQRYCPAVKTLEIVDNGDGTTSECESLKHYQILFDGDQLTIARARGAIRLRENHAPDEQINSFQPAITDWHSQMTLVSVSIVPFTRLSQY